jgi:hypothetical protein
MRLSVRPLLIALTLTLISLPAVHPLLQGQMPLTADGTLHLYRLVALDHALSDGTLWTRYVAGMTYGYGAPMFNYYSPLSLYPMLLLHKLGLSFLQSWLWGMALYTLVAAFGAYLLGKRWSGEVGGLVTAAAYVYAPYTLYDSLWRGTVAEFASLSLLPFVLWALTNVALYGRRRDWLVAVLSFALFVPMHNVITLHGSVLIGVYTLFLWATQNPQPLVSNGIKLFSPLVLGLMLTAFFWLPALTETGYVKIDAITATNPTIDVVSNLTDLGDVLALPMTADPTQLQPPISISLSWTQIILALIGVVLVFSQPQTMNLYRVFVLFALLLIAVLVLMNTEASAFLWQNLPLIRYSQFPSRLLGLASLLLAVLAGIGAAQMLAITKSRAGAGMVAAASLSAVVIYGFPYLYPIYLPQINPQNIRDLHEFERETGFVTTSSFGEYLPVWNFEPPDADKLISRFEQTPVISRLNGDVAVVAESWGHTWGQVEVEAARETTLTFDWFYFPGWQATRNGQPLELSPTSPEGFISATIPSGRHTLEIRLANTDRQNLAWAISAVGLGLALVGAILFKGQATSYENSYMPRSLIVTTLATAVLLFGFKIIVIDRVDTVIKRERFANGIAEGVQNPVNVNFGNTITLLGYDLPQPQVETGGMVDLTLYWQLQNVDLGTDYSSVVSLLNSDGIAYVQLTNYQPGGLATRHWMPNYYVQERASLVIPPYTPPGIYSVSISLYDPIAGRSLDLINAMGNPEGVALAIEGIEVTRSEEVTPPSFENVTRFAPNLSLLPSFDLPEQATVGQEVTFFWTWHLETEQPEVAARLEWVKLGEVIGQTQPLEPVKGLDNWQPGDTWRGAHRVYVPGDLENGTYDIAIVVGNVREVVDSMTVTAPERVYELPELEYTSDAVWQNGIKLAGYNIDNQFTLYWQTDQPIDQNLNVFVHIVNEEEIIVAQSAGVPASYTRPTTGWAVGEVIVDIVNVPVPTESGLEVRVGWFDPITGERVHLSDGSDLFVLRKGGW